MPLKQPLIILDNYETRSGSLVMDKESLEVLKEYEGPAAAKLFGNKGEDGVMVAKVKGNAVLLRLDNVLDYFEVPAANKTLTVLVDNRVIDPDLFLADVRQIEKIEVTKQDITSPMLLSLDREEKFLNIVTKK